VDSQNRQLAAILFTDVEGYTALMQQDEKKAVDIIKRYITVLQNAVPDHNGKILNDFGDGNLCTFPSATQAVRCAIEIQQQLNTDPVVPLRIGLHLGEIFFEGEKVLGDAVNIASRIQSLGQSNTILFSKEIFDKIRNQSEFKSVSLGLFDFKNVDDPVEVFALSNIGLVVPKKEEMKGKLKEIKEKSRQRKIFLYTAAILLVTVVFFTYQNFRSKGFTGGDKSIAVLPFDNIGISESDQYISDGITQDIINNLSKISSLQKVIGWYSAKNFKKTNKTPAEIGNELNVASLLTGTIQKNGDKIHIIAELIDVNTRQRLWGEDFEYGSNEILSIQTNIAAQIVNALQAGLTLEEQKTLKHQSTENLEAFKLYRKGISFWNKGGQQNYDSAEVLYKQALDIEPDYALAYSGLANCYIFSKKIKNQLEGIPIAKLYIGKALSIDSNLCEALTTLGWIQGAFDYDWAKSKITLEKAIKLNPNYGGAHLFYGNLLQYTGENTEKGINEVKRAIELDPLNARYNWVLARNYLFSHQTEAAIVQSKKTLLLDPAFFPAQWIMALAFLDKKMFPQAFENIHALPHIPLMNTPNQIPVLSYAYALSGDSVRALSEIKKTLQDYPDQQPYPFAYTFVALKNYNEAINYLEKGYATRDINMYYIHADPIFDPIRKLPGFRALMHKMNFE